MALIDCFTRVFAYVRLLADGRIPGPEPKVAPEGTSDAAPVQADFETVRRDIEVLVARGEEQAAAAGTSREKFRKAEFPVCCWIDEILLKAQWPGKDEWLKRPLQRSRFNTINGGEEFFTRMDAAQALDDMELVEVFHACISLGFTGRFYQENQQALLDEISLAQAKRLYGEDAALLNSMPHSAEGSGTAPTGHTGHTPFFPDAYAHDTAPRKRPLRAYRFLDPGMLLVLLLPGLAVLGLYIYYRHELDSLLEQMLRAV